MGEIKPWYPTGEGWIEWEGGENPVPGAVVDFLLSGERDNRFFNSCPIASEDLDWERLSSEFDGNRLLAAYRVVTPAPSTVDRALFDEMVEALQDISDLAQATMEVTAASTMADIAYRVLSKVREASK